MRDFLEGRKGSRHMGGALEVGRENASSDHGHGCSCEGTTMLTHVVFQVISALTHGALRGPISRERVAHRRTMKSVGTTTTTGMTLRTLGMRRAMGTLRMVSALVGAMGALRTVGTLMSARRAVGTLLSARRAVGTLRGCHIYLATGISIRGSGVVSTPSSADRF